MASGIYNRAKYNWMAKVISMTGDTINAILLNNSHSFNADNNVLTDINTNELASTGGYTTNGVVLANKSLTQDDSNDRAYFDADDVAWTSATFSAYHLGLFDDTVSGDPLLCSIDFGGVKTVSGGTFTVSWNVSGIIRIA